MPQLPLGLSGNKWVTVRSGTNLAHYIHLLDSYGIPVQIRVVPQKIVIDWVEVKQKAARRGMLSCPGCQSEQVVHNGHIHNGKAKYACKACGRQFVENPQSNRISDEKRALVDKLLLERVSQAGIARVVGVSERWVNGYVSARLRGVPQIAQIEEPQAGKKGR